MKNETVPKVMLPSGKAIRVVDGDTVSVGNELLPADTLIRRLISERGEWEAQAFWFVWGRLTTLTLLFAAAFLAHGMGTMTGFLLAGGTGAAAIMQVPQTARKFRRAVLAGRIADRIQAVLQDVSDLVWKARMEGRGW